jgi:hypothetical protein
MYRFQPKARQDESMGRILYTGREPGGQSFLWPGHCWPDLAIYPHARTEPPFPVRRPCTCLFDVAPGRGCRVSPCDAAGRCQPARHGVAVPVRRLPPARFADSSLWPCSSPDRCCHLPDGRPLAATLPYGVRTFLETRERPAIARFVLRKALYPPRRELPGAGCRMAQPERATGLKLITTR